MMYGYFENYEEIKMSKFKIGDEVKVVKKVEEENGWNNSWVYDMTETVNNGKTYAIAKISDNGVYLKSNDGTLSYGYPVSSLELVEKECLITPPNSEFTNHRGTKYQYLIHKDMCISIATTIRENSKGDAIVDWNVSFKNPKDQFNKRLAREVLATRSTKQLIVESGYSRSDIVAKILSDLFYNLENISADYKWYVVYLLQQYVYEVYLKMVS